MARMIDLDKAIEIIEEKQKELCPVGRYGRNYVYGSDREKYDDWEEIIDALEHLSTLTPPNEPLTLDKKRMIAKSCLHYSKSGSCTLRGYAPLDCPRCKEWQSNESNEPLTLEELREMDEPVWAACKPIEGGNGYWCLCQHGHIITPAGSIYNVKEIPHWVFYRRPPEGEA